MNQNMHNEWVARAKHWCERIISHLETNAPDAIVGHAVASFFSMSLGFLGREIAPHFMEHLLASTRQRIGRCDQCDTEIEPIRTYPPLCGTCSGKEKADIIQSIMETPNHCGTCKQLIPNEQYGGWACAFCDGRFCDSCFGEHERRYGCQCCQKTNKRWSPEEPAT